MSFRGIELYVFHYYKSCLSPPFPRSPSSGVFNIHLRRQLSFDWEPISDEQEQEKGTVTIPPSPSQYRMSCHVGRRGSSVRFDLSKLKQYTRSHSILIWLNPYPVPLSRKIAVIQQTPSSSSSSSFSVPVPIPGNSLRVSCPPPGLL